MKNEKGKVVRSKYKAGKELRNKKGETLFISRIEKIDKNRRARYRLENIDRRKIYPSLTSQQIDELMECVNEEERIERNKRFRVLGREYSFKDIDKLLGLKRGSSLRYYKRHGRNDEAITKRIRNHLYHENLNK